MATHQQAIDSGVELREALDEAANDGRFEPEDRDDFAEIHASLSRRLADFTLRPKNGASSPTYDGFKDKADAATAALAAAQPGAPASIAKAKTKAQAASDALPPITAAAGD
jgi:hypothetical protein